MSDLETSLANLQRELRFLSGTRHSISIGTAIALANALYRDLYNNGAFVRIHAGVTGSVGGEVAGLIGLGVDVRITDSQISGAITGSVFNWQFGVEAKYDDVQGGDIDNVAQHTVTAGPIFATFGDMETGPNGRLSRATVEFGFTPGMALNVPGLGTDSPVGGADARAGFTVVYEMYDRPSYLEEMFKPTLENYLGSLESSDSLFALRGRSAEIFAGALAYRGEFTEGLSFVLAREMAALSPGLRSGEFTFSGADLVNSQLVGTHLGETESGLIGDVTVNWARLDDGSFRIMSTKMQRFTTDVDPTGHTLVQYSVGRFGGNQRIALEGLLSHVREVSTFGSNVQGYGDPQPGSLKMAYFDPTQEAWIYGGVYQQGAADGNPRAVRDFFLQNAMNSQGGRNAFIRTDDGIIAQNVSITDTRYTITQITGVGLVPRTGPVETPFNPSPSSNPAPSNGTEGEVIVVTGNRNRLDAVETGSDDESDTVELRRTSSDGSTVVAQVTDEVVASRFANVADQTDAPAPRILNAPDPGSIDEVVPTRTAPRQVFVTAFEDGFAITQTEEARRGQVSWRYELGAEGVIKTRVVSFDDNSSQGYREANLDNEIILKDSTGQPVLSNNGRFIDVGDRHRYSTASGSGTVSTYTAGPLKGITRIKMGDPLLGFVQFDQAGAILGNLAGKLLAGDNKAVRVVSSAALKTVGQTLGGVLNGKLTGASGADISKVLASFDEELFRNLQMKGVGAVSSFLVKELISSLGIDGFVGELANTALSEAVRSQAANLLNISTNNVFANVGNAVGSLIGTKLASELVTFDTIGGQLGSMIGSTALSIAATSTALILTGTGSSAMVLGAQLGMFAGPVAAAIGAFVGFLVGSVFGGTPRSGADVLWNEETGTFETANAYARKGGSRDVATAMASAVGETLNAIIASTGGTLLNPEDVRAGNYGMRGKNLVYRPEATRDKEAITLKVSVKAEDGAGQLITHGLHNAVAGANFKIAGGDVFVKRAFYNGLPAATIAGDFDTNLVLGNITTAIRYEQYLANAPLINALIAAEGDSAFAADVAVTIARAGELGLHRRHESDWYGGFTSLLKEAQATVLDVDFIFHVDQAGQKLSRKIEIGEHVLSDTIDIAGQVVVEGTAASDTIDLSSNVLADQRGMAVNGRIQNDIAVTDTDFTTVTSAVVSFAPSAWRSEVQVDTKADTIAEVGETFLAFLSKASGLTIAGSGASAMIVDGTAALPTLIVGDSWAAEADGYAVFRLALSKAPMSSVTVALVLKEGLATGNGVDFGGAPGSAADMEVSLDDGATWAVASSVTFPAASAKAILVRTAIKADNLKDTAGNVSNVEGYETFNLVATVAAADAGKVSNGQRPVKGVATIVDGPSTKPFVWIDDVTVLEGGKATFTVSRSARTTETATVEFSTSDRRSLSVDVAAIVDGGDGNDVIHASDRGDNVIGGAGDDTIHGGKLDDWLVGGDGNDIIDAGRKDTAVGGEGNFLSGGVGNDILTGREGSDWLDGGSGTDILTGNAGDDILVGATGDGDRLSGGSGDDQYLVRVGDGADIAEDQADDAPTAAATTNVVTKRVSNIAAGLIARNASFWAGGDTDAVKAGKLIGGEDAVVFGHGITLDQMKMVRSDNDLILQILEQDPAAPGATRVSSTQITLTDWFTDPLKRVEWIRFADGNEVRIGDFTSFVIGQDGTDDVLIGTQGNDFVWGGSGDDRLYLLGGDDIGNGGSGNDSVEGDRGSDIVIGGSGADRLMAGKDADVVTGDAGDDYIYGDDGNDLISGGRGNDTLYGGGGDDIFKFSRGDGDDTVGDEFGGTWTQVWKGSATGGAWTTGWYVDAASGEVRGPNGAVIRRNLGTVQEPDWRWGDWRNEGTAAEPRWVCVGEIDYDSVSQTLRVQTATSNIGDTDSDASATSVGDTIEFAPGIRLQDIVHEASGTDLIMHVGNGDTGSGALASLSDSLRFRNFYGNAAPTVERLAFYSTGLLNLANVKIQGGGDGADALTGTTGSDWITGGAGDDTIAGAEGNDYLVGHGGRDVLTGGTGNDILYGGTEDDVLTGGVGADMLIGGAGQEDVASYASATGDIVANLSSSSFNRGEAAGDDYDGIENLVGGAGNDLLSGDEGDNVITGGAGNDLLRGAVGKDTYVWNGAVDGSDTIEDVAFSTKAIYSDGILKNYRVYWTEIEQPAPSGQWKTEEQLMVLVGWQVDVRSISDFNELVYSHVHAPTDTPTGDQRIPKNGFAGEGWINGAKSDGSDAWTYNVNSNLTGGGEDTLEMGAGITLDSLSFAWSATATTDLIITHSSGKTLTLKNHTGPGRIEKLIFSDGFEVNLGRILIGQSPTATLLVDELLIMKDGMALLDGGLGNDVLTGGIATEELIGGPVMTCWWGAPVRIHSGEALEPQTPALIRCGTRTRMSRYRSTLRPPLLRKAALRKAICYPGLRMWSVRASSTRSPEPTLRTSLSA